MLYRTVKTDIWSDPWFETLHPGAKCLFLYLFTNDRVTACGAMEVSIARIASDTKIPAKKIAADLEAFGDKILWLPEHNLIIVRNFYKHQRSQSSENFTKAAKKAMADLPGEARGWLGGVYPELLDTPTHPIPNPYPSLGDKETVVATATALAGATAVVPPTPLKGEPKPKTPPTVKTPVPENLQCLIPSDVWQPMLAEQGLTDLEARIETEKMVDHYRDKGERRVSWIGTWRNWMRSDYRKPRGSPRNGKPNRPTQNGRTGYTIDELKRLANGESLEPARDDQAAYDPVFRVVQ